MWATRPLIILYPRNLLRKKTPVWVRGLPGLKSETWGTQLYWSDGGYPPRPGAPSFIGQMGATRRDLGHPDFWGGSDGGYPPNALQYRLELIQEAEDGKLQEAL
jgi:hypothetical protein